MSENNHGLRQIHLRYKLEAIEFYLNGGYSKLPLKENMKEWLEEKRRDCIAELNVAQLEEWNYD